MSERERRRVRAARLKLVVTKGRERSADILAYVENLRRQGYHDYIAQTAGHFGITTSVVHKHCQTARTEQAKGAA